MSQPVVPISRVVRRDEVPENGLPVTLSLGPEEREAVARFLDVPSVGAFDAELEVRRHGRAGLRVTGAVRGQVTQTCVVTLEPVESRVDERVDTIFAPEGSPVLNVELTVDELVSEEADLEPMSDGAIDVGALALEHLALGLDPYPRKPGVAFESMQEDVGRPAPFAGLAALRKDAAGE